MVEYRMVGTSPTADSRAEANEAVDRQKRYRQILSILRGREMTAKEIAVEMKALGYVPTDDRNHAAPRLTEMSQKGMVEPLGRKVCQYTGKKVTVYGRREMD